MYYTPCFEVENLKTGKIHTFLCLDILLIEEHATNSILITLKGRRINLPKSKYHVSLIQVNSKTLNLDRYFNI